MPEITLVHGLLFATMIVAGTILGWILRSNRARQEKAAVNAGWQEQIEAQRSEHDRLTDQNKGLMEQIGQYQASNKDAKNRARELSEAVQEAYSRRDNLQREIKDIRGNLEATVSERDQLQSDMAASTKSDGALDAKNAQITKLQAELENWQGRLPPLIERFQQKKQDVQQLEVDLECAHARIGELEATLGPGLDADETHIEPVNNPDALTDGRDASNDPLDDAVKEKDEEIAATDDASIVIESPTRERDALQKIKGIGPAIEKTLKEMGIVTFQQIASMNESDIDRVAQRLKGFHSRIYREDWIGQARTLRDQGIDG